MIETERLILRPVTEDDAEALFEYCQHDDVGPNAGWKPHSSIEETREVMKFVFLNKENVFGIVLKATGKLFGTIGLIADPKRPNNKICMLGYAMNKDYWGHGYASEAVNGLIDYAFNQQHFEAISAYCYPFNQRSKRVLAKCGFQYEGTLTLAEQRFDGKVLDNECYIRVHNQV